ncbi:MAG: hypothetical protein DRI81_08405, partial [Chloroflexi bacterium]
MSAQNPCGVLHFARNSEGGVLGFSKKLFLSLWSLAFLFVVTASAVQKAQKRLKPLLRTPISSAFIVAYPK